ncbi:hypothetical protein V8F06_005411 [Rhypophila decipiens]
MTTLIELTAQWTNPSDVTTVLMVIGGDVVQKALAQCTGTLYAPVCFSFGWVSFAFVALVNVLGDGRLLPPPDYPAKIFNLESGYVRENKNWVIGRILRDHERFMWRTYGQHSSGVRITIFDAVDRPSPDKGLMSKILMPWGPVNRHPFPYGWTHLLGYLVTLAQLTIAAIPIILEGDWGIMLITAGGTFLALVFGAIPQWTVEKLPGRMRSRSVFALTSGNGAKDIMVIRGLGKCWDLEDFAALDSPRNARAWETFNLLRAVPEAGPVPGSTFGGQAELGGGIRVGLSRARTTTFTARTNSFAQASKFFRGIPMGFALTMAVCIAQSVLWLLLLITVAALKANTWYLVIVGGLGMFQNAVLAAMTRPTDRRGLFIKRVDSIVTRKVMDGLMDLESEYGWGSPLVGEFFSGKLFPEEEAWWRGDREEYDRVRRKDLSRGIPRSYLPKHRSLESFDESAPGPSESAGGVEGVTAMSMSSMSATGASSVPLAQPAMAFRHPDRTRSVSFAPSKVQNNLPRHQRPDPSLSATSRTIASRSGDPAVRSVDGEGQSEMNLPHDLAGMSADAGGNDTLSASATPGGRYRQTIDFPLDYHVEESDSERTPTGTGAKGKGKELPNPFEDLKLDPW